MKKLLFGCLSLALLASCNNNVKNSSEYKDLQAERDSLLQITNEDQNNISDLMSIINEVNANFDQMKEAEKYLTLQANSKGDLTNDTKTQIKDNFQMINDILKKNKQDIENLNKKLKNAGGQAAQLRKTVEHLNAELTQRSAAILELKSALTARDEKIATLTGTVEELATQNEEKTVKIQEQELKLNTAYYIFGTSKELKEAKIIAGGFLSSPKILNESIDKSIFIQIDIRKTLEIPVYSKKVKVLSDQPKDSYTIVQDQNDQAVIKILDYKKFWSLGKFLIMQVD